MMSEKEIKLIDYLIESIKPEVCLEWGAGNSTIYFPKKHNCIKSWLAVEHNENYVKYLKDKVSNKVKINTFIIESDPYYIDCIEENKYDFILIDGLYREECLEKAMKVAKQDALILLHDSGRKEYQAFIKKYEGEELCEGEILQRDGFYAHRGLTRFIKYED